MKKKTYIILALAVVLFSSVAFVSPSGEEKAPHSLADLIHMHKDPVDGGWLPDLTGLPNQEQIELLTKHVAEVMKEETDSQCTSISSHLRMTVFQHFVIHQQMANAQNVYFDKQRAYKAAHILAMILEESSGDSTNVTGMNGRSISTFMPQTNLQHWKQLFSSALGDHISLNDQTNYGLTQTSADRLIDVFHLAQTQHYYTGYLEGKEGASTPKKIELNTAIAIRRLIWFYQDFAQGRISQSDKRIHPQDITLPQFYSRYKAGLKMALLYCGTALMFHHEQNSEENLENAMASIAYCKLGNAQSGYGRDEIDDRCYAKWVTLCPGLNIDISHLTPLSYFATRGAQPVCEKTFERLIIKKPAHK